MLNESKVLIIGAGAAGISAAARLIENGLDNVTVLEAKNRIGGRVNTVDFSDNVVELGAQWIHGERGNVVFDLAFPHKLISSSVNLNDFTRHVFVSAKGEIIPKEQSIEVLKIYYDIADRATEELKDAEGSYGEYFTNEFYKILKENPFTDHDRAEQFLDWMQKFDNSIQCSDSWFDVSAKGITKYWQCEGDPVINWKYNGYRTLFDLLTKKISISGNSKVLPIMEKIEFNKEVTAIDYSSNNDVMVKTKDGTKYKASHVIFTASLGVLKNRHSTMFIPVLPDLKQRAIKELNIGTANKIFLEFPHRWWHENCAGFSLIWSKEDQINFIKSNGESNQWLCDVFEFFTVDYQPRVLCAWIVGPNARYIESLTDVEIFEGLYLLLDMFLGKAYNIPRPDHMIRSKWYSDKHFYGSYSFRSMTSEEMNVQAKDLATPITTSEGKPLILFAGEATHDHYYSTVHGAVETGFREADRLLDFQRTRGWLKQTKNFAKTRETLNSTSESVERTKLVIVGAGIAGLAAAKTLEDLNFKEYLLLEAQEQVGGRIHSIMWNKSWIECGAQFLHGDQSKLAKLCYENQLLSNMQCKDGEGIFLRDNGSEMDLNLIQEIDDFIRTTLEDCESYENHNVDEKYMENIGRLLRCKFKKYLREKNDTIAVRKMKEELFDWNVRFLMIDNSCFTLDKLSIKHWRDFRFVGGPEYLSFKAGYSSLTKIITNGLNQKNIRLNCAVESIEWQQSVNGNERDAALTLITSDRSQILADCVIITSSLGYLKENHKKIFDPPLPSHLSLAIENLGFGLINKIFLDFGTSWWKPYTKGFQILWRKDGSKVLCESESLAVWTRDLTGFDVLQDHCGVLLGWVGGHGAYIVETLSEQEIADDCVNLLRYYLKLDNIPPIKRCVRTQWNKNKYVRGSYSHIPTNCDEIGITPANLAKPIWGTITQNDCNKEVPIIMFAGEATHESFYSTTHGAYDTGVKQAQTFLRYHVDKI